MKRCTPALPTHAIGGKGDRPEAGQYLGSREKYESPLPVMSAVAPSLVPSAGG